MFWLGAFVIAWVLLEVGWRLLAPVKPSQARVSTPTGESPSIFDKRFGWEAKPNAAITHLDEHGEPFTETYNADGFRGKDRVVAKSANVFRIVAMGDSLVQSFSVRQVHSWPEVLERKLVDSQSLPQGKNLVEVMNGGIGAYASCQVLPRFKHRVEKYRPDLVVLHVGWNDICLTALPYWRSNRNINLTEAELVPQAPPQSPAPRWHDFIFERSRVLSGIRDIRSRNWTRRNLESILVKRQIDSGIAFNGQALNDFEENLAHFKTEIGKVGTQLAVIAPPCLFTSENASDPDALWMALLYLVNYPLSVREFMEWRWRYNEAIRRFAEQNPDVTLIDVERAFEGYRGEDRLSLFTDLAHLSILGNEKLAEICFQALSKRWLPLRRAS